MAQLRIQIADPKPAIREGASLPMGGGRVTQGVGQAAGPPDIERQDPGVAAAPWMAVKGAAKEAIDLAGAWQDAAAAVAAAIRAAPPTESAATRRDGSWPRTMTGTH